MIHLNFEFFASSFRLTFGRWSCCPLEEYFMLHSNPAKLSNGHSVTLFRLAAQTDQKRLTSNDMRLWKRSLVICAMNACLRGWDAVANAMKASASRN